MDGKSLKRFCVFCTGLALLGLPLAAQAAQVELSGTGSYSKSTYAEGLQGFNSSEHRYSASLEFKFTAVSGIQFEYMNSVSDVTYLTNVGQLVPYYTPENFHSIDKVYSVNWVQNLVPAKWLLQPYVKVGAGRLIRTYTDGYPEFGTAQVVSENVLTGIGGIGMRIFLTKSFAIKGEFETYVPSFRYSQWKTNENFSAGISWIF